MKNDPENCDHPRSPRQAFDEQKQMRRDINEFLSNEGRGEIDANFGPFRVRTRGYRIMDIILSFALILAGISAWFVWQHDMGTMRFQQRLMKSIDNNTAAIRFQSCIASIPQAERTAQLRRYSTCWYVGQGYAYEDAGPENKR